MSNPNWILTREYYHSIALVSPTVRTHDEILNFLQREMTFFLCLFVFLGKSLLFRFKHFSILSFLRKRAHTFKKKKLDVSDDCCYFSTSDTGGRRRRPTTPLMWFGVNVGKKMHSMNNTMKMGKLY